MRVVEENEDLWKMLKKIISLNEKEHVIFEIKVKNDDFTKQARHLLQSSIQKEQIFETIQKGLTMNSSHYMMRDSREFSDIQRQF